MTNPDRDELVNLADAIDAATAKVALWPEKRCGGLPEGELGRVFMDFLNVRNLASDAATALRRLASSDGGVKGEPVAWLVVGSHSFTRLKSLADSWQRSGVTLQPVYTAQPADAGMREALQEAYIAGAIAVHNEWLAAFERGEGPPRGDPDFSEAASDYAALTAPGATTKSDGGGHDR